MMIPELKLDPNTDPFDLRQQTPYQRWRDHKLSAYPLQPEALMVEVSDPRTLTRNEHQELLRRCRYCNMAVYVGGTGNDPAKSIVTELGRQFGLEHLDHNMGADEDAVTALQMASDALHQGYIPYTDRPIAWHTDGYYNTPERQIRGMVLHCVEQADTGGENDLMDHEIAYILLRDENPDYIRALSQPDAMTIPANIVDGETLRPDRSGPVFSVNPDGRLHMRYTARTRSIEWKNDPMTEEAVAFLARILKDGSPYALRTRLQSGQGLLANNVLHTRSRFHNGAHQRLLYRARYYDRIRGT